MLACATDEEIRYLYEVDRLRLREIASKFGCSVSAVSLRMKKANISTRRICDYPTTENQRRAWREIGKSSIGRKHSEAAKKKMSQAKRGLRKRNDYEFGGHEKKRRDGYIKVYVPEHPNSTKDGYVMKHILVIEKEIGRYLLPGECVHHRNRVRDDNRLENLALMTKEEHAALHMRERHEKRRIERC